MSSTGTIVTVHILLVSTYELGHQPLHVAAPTAELVAAGHRVANLDLAVERWDPRHLEGIDAVAISVPMHTALRLAVDTARRVKTARPDVPVAFYGLYASVGGESHLGTVADRLITGEYDDALVEWVGSADTGVSVDIGRRRFRTPDRRQLPGLDRYAHLELDGERRLAGYVEASHGCRHRCAHCPLPAVYDGRYRITGADTVLADIAQQVEAGAAHISFGDPDFLNAPAYALGVIEKAHADFPHLTFDITVKVEHILAHRSLLGALAGSGVIFATSAMETLDDRVLGLLDKGHTADDAHRAVDTMRNAGIDIHPTWLPFTPWTTPATVAGIARFVWDHDLAPVTDPVQLTIRLLVPEGSLMLDIEDFLPHVIGYDPAALGHTWRSADPAMDDLQRTLAGMAETAAAQAHSDPVSTLAAMTAVIGEATGTDIPVALPDPSHHRRPRLSEAWFCCSEPTTLQVQMLERIGSTG